MQARLKHKACLPVWMGVCSCLSLVLTCLAVTVLQPLVSLMLWSARTPNERTNEPALAASHGTQE